MSERVVWFTPFVYSILIRSRLFPFKSAKKSKSGEIEPRTLCGPFLTKDEDKNSLPSGFLPPF